MIDVKNALEVINEIIVLPVAILTFILLVYMSVFLWKKDPDIIRSRIFLKYLEFKMAFLLLALFAFVLILHVLLIYIPHFFLFDYSLIEDLQRFFGLALILIMVAFVIYIYRSMKY